MKDIPGVLVTRSLLNALGTGAYLAGSAVFFTRYIGLSVAQVGIGLSVQAAVGFLVSVPVGLLVDRLGAWRSWVCGAGMQTLLFALYPQAHGFLSFLTVVVLLALSSSVSESGRSKCIGEVVPQGARVRASAFLNVVNNTGLALGTGMAAVAIAADSKPAYLALVYCNAASFAAEVVLLLVFRDKVGEGRGARRPVERTRRGPALRDIPFVTLSAINGLIMLRDPLLLAALPLWVIEGTDAPKIMVAAVLIVNMVLAILLQMPLSGRAEDVHGASRAQRRAGLALSLAAVVFGLSGTTTGTDTNVLLVAGMVALTVGELYSSAGAWGMGYALAPAERRAEYLAVYDLGRKLAWVAGPAALTSLLLSSPLVGWTVTALVFAAAGLASLPAANWLLRARGATAADQPPQEARAEDSGTDAREVAAVGPHAASRR